MAVDIGSGESTASWRELRRISVGDSAGSSIILAAGSILDYHGDAIVNAANEGCVGPTPSARCNPAQMEAGGTHSIRAIFDRLQSEHC